MDPLFILLRLIVPLLIFRKPLLGALLSLALDGLDWHVSILPVFPLHTNYMSLDKALDLYYLSIEAYIACSWKSLPRIIAITLYLYRAVGIVLFLWTKQNVMLFFFANVFEMWFLYVLLLQNLVPTLRWTSWKQAAITVITLAIPKYFQEYAMHVPERLTWRQTTVSIATRTVSYDHVIGQIIIMGILIGISYINISFIRHHKV